MWLPRLANLRAEVAVVKLQLPPLLAATPMPQ